MELAQRNSGEEFKGLFGFSAPHFLDLLHVFLAEQVQLHALYSRKELYVERAPEGMLRKLLAFCEASP